MFQKIAVLLLGILLCFYSQANTSVTFASLLDEMVDRDELPKLSRHSYKLKQASSYDRKSLSPSKDWYANLDGSGYIRTEVNSGRVERVLMEDHGPGVVVRFWGTYVPWGFSGGKLRFYFDGANEPTIEANYVDIMTGKHLAGGIFSQLIGKFWEENHFLGGNNLYLPIPYAKGVKITYQGDDDPFYFVVNYRSYAPDTQVKTFTMQDLQTHKSKIAQVEKELSESPFVSKGTEFQNATDKHVLPGQSFVLNLSGERAIRQLALKIDAEDINQALRSTVLEIEFDNQPSVWSPVGDFFGTGYSIFPYKSRYTEVTSDGGLYSRWIMPFKQNAKITLHNLGEQAVTIVNLGINHSTWDWDERSLYFNASWRLYSQVPAVRGADTNYVTLTGRGKYVGDSLAIFNAVTGNEEQPWWGEGDEKVYIDGEPFPSHFGTGTEDYYGYAWVGNVPFSLPFISQPTAQGNRGPGLTVNSRWRILDDIPFEQSLKFDMELWGWVQDITVDYAPTVFWYGERDTKQVQNLDGAGVVWTADIKGAKTAIRQIDRIEGEEVRTKSSNEDHLVIHTFPRDTSISNRAYWMMRNLKIGERVDGFFFAGAEQTGTLELAVAHSPDSMIVDILLNDNVLLEKVDLSGSKYAVKKHHIKNVRVKKGSNRLSVIANASVKQRETAHEAGIDYIQIINRSIK